MIGFKRSNQLVNIHGFGKALELEASEITGDEFVFDRFDDITGGENARAEIFVQPFHPRGQIDVLTECGVIDAIAAAEIAHTGQARMKADPSANFHTGLIKFETCYLVAESNGAA